MLTRRGLFGLAFGGAVAASTLPAGASPVAGEPDPNDIVVIWPDFGVSYEDAISGKGKIEAIAKANSKAVDDLLQRAGGFGTLQARYESRQA